MSPDVKVFQNIDFSKIALNQMFDRYPFTKDLEAKSVCSPFDREQRDQTVEI